MRGGLRRLLGASGGSRVAATAPPAVGDAGAEQAPGDGVERAGARSSGRSPVDPRPRDARPQHRPPGHRLGAGVGRRGLAGRSRRPERGLGRGRRGGPRAGDATAAAGPAGPAGPGQRVHPRGERAEGREAEDVGDRRGPAAPSSALRSRWSCTARSEWPPSSKKFSEGRTSGRPRSRCQTAATRGQARLRAVAGPSAGGGAARRGRRRRAAGRRRRGRGAGPARGSALRSTLRFGVSGKASSRTIRDGTMCAGSRAASASRRARSSNAPADRDVGHEDRVARRPPAPSPRPGVTPGSASSAASISPASMRWPRTLTWWSARPRKSSVAVRAPPHEVAGAVEPRRRPARRRTARP